jgi:hypothetical protein
MDQYNIPAYLSVIYVKSFNNENSSNRFVPFYELPDHLKHYPASRK